MYDRLWRFAGAAPALAGAPGLALHNDVMIGQGDIISAEPAQRIAAMGEMARQAGIDLSGQDPDADLTALQSHPPLAEAFAAYLAKFSDRCPQELKLESIPLKDKPAPLLAAIAASAGRAHPQGERTPPNWQGLFKGKPLKRWIARRIVGWAKARVKDRENLRFERTRVFGYARQVFLALGREFWARGFMDDPRDVFYLTKDEILGTVEGSALSPNLSALIALRKQEQGADARHPDLDERIETRDLGPVYFDKNGGKQSASHTPQTIITRPISRWGLAVLRAS